MSIEFILDENIPFALIDLLEKEGFLVKHLKKIGKSDIRNGEVYLFAEKTGSWIITRDADFQNLDRFTRHKIGGVILFKLSKTKTRNLLEAIKLVLDTIKDKLTEKHLIIVEDDQIKVL